MRVIGAVLRGTGRGLGRGLAATGRWSVRGGRATYQWLSADDARTLTTRRRLLVGLVWLLAIIFFFVGFGTAEYTYDIGLGVAPFFGAIAGLPVLLAVSRFPATGWAISVTSAYVLGVTVPTLPGLEWQWPVVHGLALFVLLFAVCAREEVWRGVGAWFVTSLLYYWGTPEGDRAGWIVAVTAVALLGLLSGRLVRTQRRLARQEEAAKAEMDRRIILEERTRIARDLHDIVAHHMSLVVVQAETAPYRLGELPADVRAELESISTSARSALAETRSLLNVLRQEGQAAEHAPQPGLEVLDDLVDGARRAGMRIDAEVRGGLEGLRPGTSLAAYRIVQEALANAARHAPGAGVRLTVSRAPDTLDLLVVNEATDQPVAPDAAGGGHGLPGMRERVQAEGGSMSAGPTGDGGFAVHATLPLATAGPA
ncbi:sensor histidine kinase [Spongisporangium articulatum]|uniref:histidine kinase n=1 Tax=Spongisporangium articulatum TaxID=3362603 RepID=A0ABW8ALL6_9ACTN